MVLALLVLGLVWLNGPGLRWIAPHVAIRFLEKAGLRGNFKVHGNLIGGLSISDLKIEGDKELASLTIDKVTPDYQWRGLIRGRLEGLTVEGVHADLRLGLEKSAAEKPPLDLKKLVETLRSARGRVVPLELDLKNISLAATRDGKPFLALAPSRIFPLSGSDDLLLELGAFTDVTGREWPTQKSTIVWSSGQALDRARRSLSRREYPRVGGAAACRTANRRWRRSCISMTRFSWSPARPDSPPRKSICGRANCKSAKRRNASASKSRPPRRSPRWPSSWIKFSPIRRPRTAAVRLLLEDLAWKDWNAPELSLDATLTADQSTIAARGMMLGTEFSLDATAPVTRGENYLHARRCRREIQHRGRPGRPARTRRPRSRPSIPRHPSRRPRWMEISPLTLAENKPQAASRRSRAQAARRETRIARRHQGALGAGPTGRRRSRARRTGRHRDLSDRTCHLSGDGGVG